MRGADFSLSNHGSICLLTPITQRPIRLIPQVTPTFVPVVVPTTTFFASANSRFCQHFTSVATGSQCSSEIAAPSEVIARG